MPRPMKMGNIAPPRRYDARSLRHANSLEHATDCDLALRPRAAAFRCHGRPNRRGPNRLSLHKCPLSGGNPEELLHLSISQFDPERTSAVQAASACRMADLRSFSALGVKQQPLTRPTRLMVMRAAVSHSSIEIPAANTAIARCSAGF